MRREKEKQEHLNTFSSSISLSLSPPVLSPTHPRHLHPQLSLSLSLSLSKALADTGRSPIPSPPETRIARPMDSSSSYSTRCSNKHHLFSGPEMPGGSFSSSSSSCGWDSSQQKRQRSSVSDIYDNEPAPDVIIGKHNSDCKDKKPLGSDTDWQKQVKDASPEDLTGFTDNILESDALEEAKNSAEPGDSNLSDMYADYYENDDDYEYDEDAIDNDCSYGLAAKFDDLDLPPGVEATVPWLQKTAPERPRRDKGIVLEEDLDIKFKSFKQFDTVDDYSDHHYAKEDKDVKKPSKDWMKKIQQDWKILENDLPETIFVRAYEERMDLLRAVIVGPAGTPYHDGLFFFDFQFPSNYPHIPPKAHYHSGGLRLNPNLYACGKVCLSLLGTWSGQGCEKWDPNKSTMLQVLVSIQALVLNERPYFNEPGYEMTANTNHGEKSSLAYNETAFLYSCKTMMYSLRRPPKYFEDFVGGHFRKHGHAILVACRAYLDSAQVGSTIVENKGQDAGGSSKGCSHDFKKQLRQIFEDLLMEFTVKGADCKEFLNQKVKVGDATALPAAKDTL